MKVAAPFIALTLSVCSFGQLPVPLTIQYEHGRTLLLKEPLPSTDISAIHAYAIESSPNLQSFSSGVETLNEISSPHGHHVRLQQTFAGVPIYGVQVKVNLDKHSQVRSMFDRSIETETWLPGALKMACERFKVQQVLASIADPVVEHKLVIWPKTPEPALQVITFDPASHRSELLIVDATGKVLVREDLVKRFHGPDSLVTAMVFMPDPVTSAQTVYGGQYTDMNDGENPVLNAQLEQVQMRVAFTGGEFRLENEWVVLGDVNPPSIAPPVSTAPDFSFTRGQDGFEDVNAYFHLTNIRAHLEHIGFGALGGLLLVDAHALDGKDQSFFVPSSSPPRLLLGEGGVDDGEDADVIIHEYGHHLAFAAAPGTSIGFERQAMEEGHCDYIAASYSRAINDFNWDKVFQWDGHNEFWPGRVVNSNKVYPNDVSNDLHLSGEIWSAAMMDIWETLGRDYTDQLALQAMYNWEDSMSMPEAALMVMQADEMLSGGANQDVIYQAFLSRGLLGDLENDITNSMALLGRSGNLIVTLSSATDEANIEVFDIRGRLMFKAEGVKDKFMEIRHELFSSSAVYIVRLTIGEQRIVRKVVMVDR